MQGARVIGIAGSPEKCAWVVDELGFDACINYKTEDVAARLKELAPEGVDVFFDNVGGELLDTVLRRLAMHARIVLCGDISTYNLDGPPPPLHNIRYIMGKRARMEGFNTLDHWDQYHSRRRPARRWVADGTLKFRERRARRLGPRARGVGALVRGRPPRQAGGSSRRTTEDAYRWLTPIAGMIAAEREDLADVPRDADARRSGTRKRLCDGWKVKHVAAHIVPRQRRSSASGSRCTLLLKNGFNFNKVMRRAPRKQMATRHDPGGDSSKLPLHAKDRRRTHRR